MHLAAAAQDGVAHILDDAWQFVGADVRVGVGEDGGGGAMLAEHIQYFVDTAPFFGASIEFSVGIGARSPLAETVVALRVHLLCAGDGSEVFFAFSHILTPFDDDGAQVEFDKTQCGEEATRSSSHHDDSGTLRHITIMRDGKGLVGRHLVDIDPHSEIDHDIALARIDTSLEHPHMADGAGVDGLLTGNELS